MCGISAHISNVDVISFLIESLYNLQNRGYDSSGVSFIRNDTIETVKKAFTKESDCLELSNKTSNAGIAHNRWATHGNKTDKNSHPHVSNNGKFSLVHNGIIENYLKLKEELLTDGYVFKSDTDSEVIVNLVQKYYKDSLSETLNYVNTLLKGSWAICVLSIEAGEPIICATKKENPLVFDQDLKIITSEISGFCNKSKKYIIIEDYDVITLTKTNWKTLKQIEYVTHTISDIVVNNKDGFEHWTLKEIYEQKSTVLKSVIIDGRIHKETGKVVLEGLDNNKNFLKTVDNLIFVGCGTSFNAALFGKHYFKNFNLVQVINASEFTEQDVPKLGKTVMFFLSQSGETKDTFMCLQKAKNMGIFTIGIVNVRNSLIAREVDCGCYINVGKEVGVASTKSFTGQVIVLYLISQWFSERSITQFNLYKDISETLKLHDHIKKNITPIMETCSSCFILGKGHNYALAREGALKIKEISYIHAEAYELSELKHGPFALLTSETVVILIGDHELDACYHEIKSRGSKIIVISNINTLGCPNLIQVPSINYIAYTIPLQLLAYECSVSRGINPDKPRNLAKVVTVG